MEKKILNNIRFPHRCIVKRVIGETPFKEGDETLIYEGVCRRETSANIRNFKTGTSSVGQVMNVDFRISIPGKWDIHKGDIVSVDYIIGKTENAVVTNPNYSSLKTRFTPEGATEFFYQQPEY